MHASESLLRGQHQTSKTHLYRPIIIWLSFFFNVLYFTGFSSVVSTREIGTQSQCMLLIDPDDEEEEHDRKNRV